jgi:hypothetical protein
MSALPERQPRPERVSRYDIAALKEDLAGIALIDETQVVRKRSRDFFWYSPILNEQLSGKSADIIVAPRDEADVLKVAAACARHRVPITPRGGGTGNYGQAVPLQGGVLLDMTALSAIEWQKQGVVRVGTGAKMHEMDAQTRPQGWEIRLHPSTKRTATIGGFVAGGSGGIGGVTYGGLREAGNILAARVVTVEEEPRIIELRGDAAQKVNRAYGTTGIITALELPLAPAWNWIDVVVAFDRLLRRLRRRWLRGGAGRRHREEARDADRLGDSRLISVCSRPHCPQGKSDPDLHDRRRRRWRPFKHRRRQARRDHPTRQPSRRECPARCRSTSTPGTTRRCSG